MTVAAFIHELSCQDVELAVQDGQLDINAPAGVLTDDVVSQLRKHKTEILTCLADRQSSSVEGGQYADFDHPEIVRRLDEGNYEYKDFPRYEAALQQGLLMICRDCEFYKGPRANALGWCRKFDTEAAPDVPFTCGAASRA
jgi:hypothetical protein